MCPTVPTADAPSPARTPTCLGVQLGSPAILEIGNYPPSQFQIEAGYVFRNAQSYNDLQSISVKTLGHYSL